MNTSLKNQKLKELLSLREIDLCQKILSKASEEDLSDAQFLQLANEIERILGNRDKALTYAQLLQKKFPNRPVGHAKVAQDLMTLGDLDLAIQTIEEIITSHPENQLLLQVAAQAYRESGNLIKALQISRALIKVAPDRLIGFHYASKDLLKLKKFAACLNTVQSGLRKHKGDLYLLQLGIEAARSSEDIDKVLDLSSELKAFHPEDPSGFTCCAQSHLHNQNFERALDAINDGLVQHPKNLLLLQLGIETARSLGKIPQSLAFGNDLLSVLPNEITAYCATARDLIDLSKADEALTRVQKGLEKQPKSIQLIQIGIEASRSNGNLKLATEYGKLLTLLSPNEYNGYINASKDLSELGNLKDAEKIINKLQHIHPNTPEPLYHAREFYRSIGNRKKSLNLSHRICLRFGKTDANLLEEASDLIALGRLKDSRITKLPATVFKRSEVEHAIRFLLKEEANRVIPSTTRATLSALKVYNHFNKDFNPTRLDTGHVQDQITICVIHIGKCAGESILNTLRENINNKAVRIIEFHIFDTNIILPDFFRSTLQSTNIHWIILTRDPLSRWISAFNWDQHIFSINSHLYCHTHFKRLIKKYKNAKKLIQDLMKNKKAAIELSNFHHLACGHMRMGQAWYLDRFPLDQLVNPQTSIIRTEHIDNDYERCIDKLKSQFPCLEINNRTNICRAKSNYQNRYRNGRFTKPQDLSDKENIYMRSFLSKDYSYHNQLIQKFTIDA